MTTPRDASPSGRSGQQERMYFSLDQLTGARALDDISELTGNFNDSAKLTPEFVSNLKESLKSVDNLFHGYLYSPKDSDITRQVIGKNGCYFHKTTTDCGIYFIWHNRKTNRFEFWGQKKELIRAMNIIRSRIYKYTQHSAKELLSPRH